MTMYPNKPTGDNVISESYIFGTNNVAKTPMTNDELLEGYNNYGETETELTSIPDANKFNSFWYQMHNTLAWVDTYISALFDNKLEKSGGTVTGTIDMGAQKVTTTYAPVNNADLTNKLYVDTAVSGAMWLGETKYLSYPSIPTLPAGMEVVNADGRALSRSTYSSYFALIGTTYGAGDGSTTFNIPDLRGVHIRGWDGGRNLDSGRVFGTYQSSGAPNITGGNLLWLTGNSTIDYTYVNSLPNNAFKLNRASMTYRDVDDASTGDNGPKLDFDASRASAEYKSGLSEVRVKNLAMYPVVRIK